MEVKLIARSRLDEEFEEQILDEILKYNISDGQAIAMTAIRTCYSHLKPTEILKAEAHKYFGREATDGLVGTDADRLIRHIMRSGHHSTVEHLFFTFSIEGISRSCLAQLTRHRVGYSYSVQSQRYVKFSTKSRSGGYEAVVPPSIQNKPEAIGTYFEILKVIQEGYDKLQSLGISAEDARMLLPNAAKCNLVLSCNLRGALEFYRKRGAHTHAQWEIKEVAERIRQEIVKRESWTDPFFEAVKQ